MHDYEDIDVEWVEGVARITLNRPHVMNAVTHAMLAELLAAIEQARAAREIRCLLLAGRGDSYCAGLDLKASMSVMGGGKPLELVAGETAGLLHQVITAIHRCDKPVICAVHGKAAGGGFGLAVAADIVIAARSASFRLAYSAIGLAPDGGSTWLLPRMVGPKVAADLLMTNRDLGSEEALARGVVSRVVDDEALADEAWTLASCLAKGPTRSFAQAKKLLRQSLTRDLETHLEDETEGVRRTVTSKDFAEGVMAFVQKREPRFEGR